MSKAVFSKIVNKLENGKQVIVNTDSNKWYLFWATNNDKFWASIERQSKHEKEQTKIFDNNTNFFNAIQNIARNKGLQVTDCKTFDEIVLK